MKKLKTLKKQKTDEAAERKRVEGEVRNLTKEKQQLEKAAEEAQSALQSAAELANQFRELHKQCAEQLDQLKPLVEDAESLAALPEMPAELLSDIERATRSDEKK